VRLQLRGFCVLLFKYDSVDMTKFLLEHGYDPFLVNDGKLLSTEISFRYVTAGDGRLGDSIRGHEKGKKIVQGAIDRKKAETSEAASIRQVVEEFSRTSESEEKPHRSSRRSRKENVSI
jgi:hypothetical protein